jgi:hypothetical protein
LRKWIDAQTNSEYHEARFKKGTARKIRDHGENVNEVSESIKYRRRRDLASKKIAKHGWKGCPLRIRGKR